MKQLLLFFLIFISPINIYSQTQQGYVKTRGRLSSTGQLIPGVRLQGATISVKNGGSHVSGNNGKFSFAVTSQTYYLTNVEKKDYQLCDRDVLGKGLKYSPNPLVIVMDTPDRILEDRLESEGKIRATLTAQLNKQKAELKQLKDQQKVSQQEYNKLLQELYALQNNNEKLISEMAERYSTIDFEEMDDFRRRVAFFIQNGELTRADSLLNTQGTMDEQEAEYDKLHASNALLRKNLQQREKMEEIKLRNFVANCYSRYEICKFQHKNDSAAYWLARRVSKDSMNVEYIFQLGNFLDCYTGHIEEAKQYYLRCLSLLEHDQSNLLQISYINSLIGLLETKRGNNDASYNYFAAAAKGWIQYTNLQSYAKFEEDIKSLNDEGNASRWDLFLSASNYIDMTKLDYRNQLYVYQCFKSILNITFDLSDDFGFYFLNTVVDPMRPKNPDLPERLRNCTFENLKIFDQYGNNITDIYYPAMLEFLISKTGANSIDVADFCNENWMFFPGRELEILRMVLTTYEDVYGTCNNKTIDIKRTIALYCIENDHYAEGLEYILNEIMPYEHIIQFANFRSLQLIYEYLGVCYEHLGKYDSAIEYYKVFLKFLEARADYEIPYIASINRRIGESYLGLKDYANAKSFLEKAKDIFSSIDGAESYDNEIEELQTILNNLPKE